MTDGIIQEAFFDFLTRNYFKSDKGLVVSVEQVIAFRKELIEKIKQDWYWEVNSHCNRINFDKLIGDNQ